MIKNNKILIASPEEVKRLRKKSGLKNREMAEFMGIGISSWQKKEIAVTSGNHNAISKAEYHLLLLLAGEHPDFILEKRKNTAG